MMYVKIHANFRIGEVKHGTYVSGTKGPHGNVALSFTQQITAEGADCSVLFGVL